MGAETLAAQLGLQPIFGRELLAQHKRTFPRFWQWLEEVQLTAKVRGKLQAALGWELQLTEATKLNTLSNWPCQATGSEMLRLAVIAAVEHGIRVCAPVHDALLIAASADEIDEAVCLTRNLMRQASRIVLSGFEVRTDVKIVRHPDRWTDPRGAFMWEKICSFESSGRRQRSAQHTLQCPRNQTKLWFRMNLKKVLLEINAMEADGIVDRYAIGGAVGATFYLEPVATLDVDVFISFQAQLGSLQISPEPVFKYLTGRGARIEGEYLIIADWPVQFLPPTGPLVEEALEEAVEVEVEEIRTRVFTAEHLAAIALQTGRPKDKARLLQFIESGAFSSERFQSILERHALAGSWRKFEQQFLES